MRPTPTTSAILLAARQSAVPILRPGASPAEIDTFAAGYLASVVEQLVAQAPAGSLDTFIARYLTPVE